MIDKLVRNVNKVMNPVYRKPFGFPANFFNDPHIDSFFKEFDSLSPFSQQRSFNAPAVDVKENETSYELTADVPGFTKDNIKLDLDEETRTLTLKGETKNEKEEKDKEGKYHIKERSSSSFERRFTIPDDVKIEQLKAQMKDGQLKIILEKIKTEQKQTPKVRSIDIQSQE
ncbi:HSP-20 domain-containing protein [Naegleria gruberi]|uniref:HSP-20 domain-containing protein n=1 Tax=Naegleria gruberi TaxID=5762 RepID=D2VQ79_NAEGR|nr:HSP-20 domain-containing protein [Naegleria gruberi]EFC41061.1 HSP-20 domain-containing protein [Naegleria gruberi]|eukprot:XP_002673805.1 HSP-20 domain-containing protein [Naegleria gruberi strain NEG-M]